MTSTVGLVLALFFIFFTRIMVNGRDVTSWGEQNGSRGYYSTLKREYAIPFATRSTEVTFPDDVTNALADRNHLNDEVKTLMESIVIRGITHYYNDDKHPDCTPILEISKGGLNQHSATLSITSKKGCGIDSKVEFFIERV